MFPQPYAKQSAISYVAYAERWIGAATSHADARARWDKERSIRNNLGTALEPEQVRKLQTILGTVAKP